MGADAGTIGEREAPRGALSLRVWLPYGIYVELENSDSVIFEVKPYLEKGVLREHLDERYFSQVGIQYGAVGYLTSRAEH
jgi:hypothetical protein